MTTKPPRRRRRRATTLKIVPIAIKHPSGNSWTPQQLLEEFVAYVQAGKIDMTQCVLHFFEREANGRMRLRRWQAGCSRAEEIALCQVAMLTAIEEWRE